MKKLQNNFTTPEQSKQLVELGAPADSADCIYVRYGRDEEFKRKFREDIVSENPYEYTDFYLPCWSVGRLIEIAHICSDSNLSYKEEAEELNRFKEAHKCETIIEAIIMCIEDAHSVGGIDFSKLED